MSAGLCILNKLNDKVYHSLEKKSQIIYDGLVNNINNTGVKAVVNRVGSMLTLFFTSKKQVCNYNDALECDTKKYAKYFKFMLDMGVYLPPSQYESLFLSSVMTDDDISKLIESNKIALEKLKYE